jgi:hypothetical protein
MKEIVAKGYCKICTSATALKALHQIYKQIKINIPFESDKMEFNGY